MEASSDGAGTRDRRAVLGSASAASEQPTRALVWRGHGGRSGREIERRQRSLSSSSSSNIDAAHDDAMIAMRSASERRPTASRTETIEKPQRSGRAASTSLM